MASGSKVAVSNTSTYIQGCIDWSTSVSGSNIVVNVSFYMRRTNNYSGSTGTSSCNQRICISGDPANYGYSQTDAVWVEGNKQNQWQGPYFSASRTFDASRGGDTIYVGWKVDGDSYGYLNGSGNVQITLPTAYQAPATPTVSASNASGSSNSVTYGTTSFGVPSSGTVYLYGGTSASPTTQIATKTTTGNSTYTHSGLAGNTRYYYRSKASNSQLSSAYSSDSSVITRPSNPSSVTLAVTGTNTATLTIKAPSMGSAATVTAYYKLNSGSNTSAGTISSGGTITKSLTGLTAGTAYTASVYFSNTSGNSGTVTSSSVTTYKAPQGLTATVTDKYSNGAKLTIGVSNYGTPASTSGRYLQGIISANNTISSDDWWSETQTNVASATVTITNANIKPNTTYYYGTYAYNTKVGTNAVAGSFVTLPAAPSAASLTVTGETTATLSITAPTMGSASTMTAYYKLNSGSYVSAGTITSGSTITKSLTGLTAGTNYTATVKITNSSGDSATTTTSQVTTWKAPQGLSVSVSSTTSTSITLAGAITSWGVPSDDPNRHVVIGVSGSSDNLSAVRERGIGTNMSATVVIDNDSAMPRGELNINPNSRYYPFIYATNDKVSTWINNGNVVTKAPLPTYVEDSLVVGIDSVSFQVSYPADGGYYPKQVRYSLDGSTYTVATTITGGSAQTATITITGLSPRTTYNIKIDTYTTAGYTQGYNTVPEFTTKGNCYGSVSGKTKQIIKGYCSIDGETAKILKIYGSKDGLTKRVF